MFGIESAFFMAGGCGFMSIVCGALAAVLVSQSSVVDWHMQVSTEVAETELELTKLDLKAATSDGTMEGDDAFPFLPNGNNVVSQC